jgi:hypothetical protein
MADELPEVEQRFVADMDEYLGELEAGVEEARAFADANLEASAATDSLRDHAAETAVALDEERDKALEAAAAAGIYADKVGNLHEANGRFLSGARAAELGIEDFKDDLVKAKNGVEDLDTETRSFASRITSTFGSGGLLGKLLGGAEGAGGSGGLTGLVDKIPTSLIAIIPALYAALAEVTGLVSGLAAAGAGAVAFGILAIPAFENVKNALGDTHAQLMKLPPDERAAVESIRSLESEWKSMSKAFEPDAFKVFNSGLKLARELLPDVVPFADTFATSLDGLLQRAGRFADSKGFKDWLAQFHALEGPSITAIGDGIGKVAGSIGKLLTTMSAKDDVHAINIAFDALAGTINAVSYVVKHLMEDWDAYSSAFRTSRHDIAAWSDETVHDLGEARHAVADWAHNTAAHFDEVRHDVATWEHDTASAFDTSRHDAASWAHDTASGFDAARHAAAIAGHDIVSSLDATRSWIASHWKEIAAWLVSPIGMAVFEIRTHTHQIAVAFDTARHEVSSVLSGMRHDVSSDFDSMRHDIAAAAGWVPHEIAQAFTSARHDGSAQASGLRHDLASDWDSMRHDLASFAGWVPHEIATTFDAARHDAAAAADGARHDVASAWDGMRHDTASTIDDVLSYFRRLPGQILSYLAGLPGRMEADGRNIIMGLIHGIESAASAIPGIMEGLAHDVESYFTDPLKMFSPSRVFFEHGINTVQGYINGIKAATPAVRAAMAQLGGQIATGGIGGAGGSATAPSVHVTVPITLGAGTQGYNDPRFLQFLQQILQEAILRYTQVNPSNGLSLAGKLG